MSTPRDECCGGACGDPQPGLCFDPEGAELVPTQWAYEQACKALWKHRLEVERLRKENEELKAIVSALEATAEDRQAEWWAGLSDAQKNEAIRKACT